MCQHAERVARVLCVKGFFSAAIGTLGRRSGPAMLMMGVGLRGPCAAWSAESERAAAMLQVLQVQSVVQGHEVRMTRYPPERHIVLGKQRESV